MNRRSSWIQLLVFAALVLGAHQASAADQLPAEGFTEPFRRIELAPVEIGTVAQLHVQEGDRVKSDQLLATLENNVQQIAVEIAKANAAATGRLTSARVEEDLRRSRLSRLETLITRGHANQEEVARARTDLEVAQANVRVAEEQQLLDTLEYKRAEALLHRREVRSPIDGIVLRVHREQGESISISAPTIVTLVQIDRLRATFSVSDAEARVLKVRQEVTVEFPDTGAKARAKVESIAPVTDPESGTVRVRVLIENPQGRYRAGVRCMFSPAAPPR